MLPEKLFNLLQLKFENITTLHWKLFDGRRTNPTRARPKHGTPRQAQDIYRARCAYAHDLTMSCPVELSNPCQVNGRWILKRLLATATHRIAIGANRHVAL